VNLVVMSVDERIPGRAKRLLIRAGPVCNTLTVAPIRCGAGCSCLVRPDPAPAPEDAELGGSFLVDRRGLKRACAVEWAYLCPGLQAGG